MLKSTQETLEMIGQAKEAYGSLKGESPLDLLFITVEEQIKHLDGMFCEAISAMQVMDAMMESAKQDIKH